MRAHEDVGVIAAAGAASTGLVLVLVSMHRGERGGWGAR